MGIKIVSKSKEPKVIKAGSADKAKQKKVAAAAKHKAPDRMSLIAEFVKETNASLKKSKSLGRVDMGKDISFLDPPRLRTGILAMDVITCGGIPQGRRTQLWGPFSCGKSTTLYTILGAAQARGEPVAIGVSEMFDKPWARKNGLLVPYDDEELMEIRKKSAKRATLIEQSMADWPLVVVLQHTYGDAVLELTYDAVKSNLFTVVGFDSLGSVKRYADVEERSVEDQKRGGEASLFGAFCSKMYSAFNTKYDANTLEPLAQATKESGEIIDNTTALVCINQARQQVGGYNPTGQTRYYPLGGEALKHFWDLSVQFTKGPKFKAKLKGDADLVYGQQIRAFVDKSKIGPPEREGDWLLYLERHNGHEPGEIDNAAQAFYWAGYFDLLDSAGQMIIIDGEKFRGKEAALAALRENPNLVRRLTEDVIAAARRPKV